MYNIKRRTFNFPILVSLFFMFHPLKATVLNRFWSFLFYFIIFNVLQGWDINIDLFYNFLFLSLCACNKVLYKIIYVRQFYTVYICLFICVSVCGFACTMVHVWRSEGNSWEPTFFYTLWVPEIKLRTSRWVASTLVVSYLRGPTTRLIRIL